MNNVAGNFELFVNNRDRDPGEDALNFTITLPIVSELMSASYAVAIDCVTTENVLPVIATGINDQLWFSYNGGAAASLTIEEGNADIYDLLAVVKATLVTLNAGFDVIFNTKQYKLELFVPAGVTFALLRTHPKPLDKLQYKVDDRADRLLEILGWSFAETERLSFTGGLAGYTWVPSNVVRVRSTSFLHLNCNYNIQQTYTSDAGQQDHPLIRIPMLHPFGTSEHYQKNQLTRFVLANATGLVLNFYFTDEWGDVRTMKEKNMCVAFQMSFILMDL